MNWFKIPKYICRYISGINRNFFWKDNCENNSKQHHLQTLASDKIYCPKCKGGLAIRKIEDMNAAFLAKED